MNHDHLTMSRRNTFGMHHLQREGPRRTDATYLQELLGGSRARIVPVSGQRNLFTADDRPAYPTPSMLPPCALTPDNLIFLAEIDDLAYFAVEIDEPTETLSLGESGTAEFRDLRAMAPLVSAQDASLLAYARAMIYWQAAHRFCGTCGAPTQSTSGGHVRECTSPTCGRHTFPRTDPAIIVLVTHGDRALLARRPQSTNGVFSTLAGFVEPGESLEAAVLREVYEEVGVTLRSVTYHSSQPWPFPGSIMIGFTAEADAPDLVLQADEIAEARWFTREELRSAIETETVRFPSTFSIAYQLIGGWLGSLSDVAAVAAGG